MNETIYLTIPIRKIHDKGIGKLHFSYDDACVNFYEDESKTKMIGSITDCVGVGGLDIQYGDDIWHMSPQDIWADFRDALRRFEIKSHLRNKNKD